MEVTDTSWDNVTFSCDWSVYHCGSSALLKDEEIEKLLQQDREITNWARTTFRNEYGKHDFKNEESLSEEHASLLVRDSKPSKPFNVDDVLKFTFTGEKPIITGSTPTSSSN